MWVGVGECSFIIYHPVLLGSSSSYISIRHVQTLFIHPSYFITRYLDVCISRSYFITHHSSLVILQSRPITQHGTRQHTPLTAWHLWSVCSVYCPLSSHHLIASATQEWAPVFLRDASWGMQAIGMWVAGWTADGFGGLASRSGYIN